MIGDKLAVALVATETYIGDYNSSLKRKLIMPDLKTSCWDIHMLRSFRR
jgi:hypothetical protein